MFVRVQASERLGAFDRDLEAFQKGQLKASQDNADAAVKADVALREERRLARRVRGDGALLLLCRVAWAVLCSNSFL